MRDESSTGISFRPTAEQRQLQALAHEFAARELRPAAPACDEEERFPPELLRAAASVGLTSYAVPREYGGGGADAVTSAIVVEELAWGCAGLAATIGATMFPVRPLLTAGTDAQREHYLPWLASEEGVRGAIAFTEPGAGSDLGALRTTARREGDGYVLDGEKCYVTNGGIADVTVVFAQLDGALTAFLVERDDPGVRPGRRERTLGLRASHTGSLLLDGARLAADRRLGDEGGGAAIAFDFFAASRPQVAASAVGLARAAFEHATAYARKRLAFGKPLLAQQGVAFKLADMAIELEAARLLTWRACAAVDAGEDAVLLGSCAKAFAADAAMRTTTEAVQVLGGAGYTRDEPVEKWMRDAKAFQVVEGTSEIQRHVIAAHLRSGL